MVKLFIWLSLSVSLSLSASALSVAAPATASSSSAAPSSPAEISSLATVSSPSTQSSSAATASTAAPTPPESDLSAQSDLLVASDSLVSNTLFVGGNEGWRFHPGDDMQWADPDFDDSEWKLMMPSGLADPIPDSLWQGYGWFRYRFAADSTMYNRVWHLYFFTWGAAEVFLDGRPVKSYGRFSTDPAGEVRNSPFLKIQPPIVLEPGDWHVLAVRYSYHRGPRYKKLLGKHSEFFGFGIGLSNDIPNQQIREFSDSAARVAYISSAMLLVLLLLHGFLFLLFPADRSNFYIAMIAALLLAHSILAFSTYFFEFDRLQYLLLREVPFILLVTVAFSLFPVTLASMFNQKPERAHKLLFLFVPVMPVVPFVFDLEGISLLVFFALVIMYFSVRILIRAVKQNEKGVWFVAAGFLGTLASALATVVYENVLGGTEWQIISLLINLVYVSLPLGMTLFMAYRFYHLYSGLETEVADRTRDLRKSLDNLRAAQSQLVQQEKLASLGQLTAGIAHEIKNPLNFVNNFSDVSLEMIDEALEELKKIGGKGDAIETVSKQNAEIAVDGATDTAANHTAEAAAILADIKSNLVKIHEHGSRADGIVKSMLQHSRGGSGKMEPTDLNALVREYVNLAFHGMRAGKDPITVDIDLQLDESVSKVPLITEDFSRVILNLCNNAFDAMREKIDSESINQDATYSPKLTVGTKSRKGAVIVEIEDNGPGIPEEVKDKILEPFFTTKKGTQGTGLGLSITHDIVKAHGGSLHIESIPSEKTVFRILINNNL